MLTELILLHWLLSSNYWITQAASFMAIKQVLTNLIIDDPNTPCTLTPQTHTGLGVGQDTGFIHLSCLLGAAFNQFARFILEFLPSLPLQVITQKQDMISLNHI